jgi:hypothetical protein
MEQITNFDNQKLIHDYESVIGPLTDTSFPFNQIISYKSYEKPDFSLSGLRLIELKENEKRFDYGFYLYTTEAEKNSGENHGVRIECRGHFQVDLKNQLLTLNNEKVEAWEPFGRFKRSDADKITELFSEKWKKIEIKNYNWFSRVITVKRPVSIPENYLEYDKYEQAEVELKLDNGITPNSEISSVQNKIERLRRGPVVTLPKTYVYEIYDQKVTRRLALHPNGTLDFYHSNNEWDRDGDWSWDSSLRARGQWIFDSQNKTITLKFLSFDLIEDSKPVDFLSKFSVPADVVTSPFTFEDDTIKCIYASWNWANLNGLKEDTFKLIRKGE